MSEQTTLPEGGGVPDIEDADKMVCGGKIPSFKKVEAGKDYYYCTCGRSKKQPFCDGSHAGTSFTPLKYTAEKTGTVKFCTCKASKIKPICDNTHFKFWSMTCGTHAHVPVGGKYDKIV